MSGDAGGMRTTVCFFRGCNSVVECKLPKLDVVGSSPITRFGNHKQPQMLNELLGLFLEVRREG